jgi:hypothetical protein
MHQAGDITAAILVIGDEILSGRTQDTNTNHIARFLGAERAAEPIHLHLHDRRHRPDA